MSSTTLSPYKDSTTTIVFNLVSESPNGVTYLVSGRSISRPFTLTVTRKLTALNAAGNDEITIQVKRTEQNATSLKLATAYAKLTISIPKDQSVLTSTVQKELMAVIASLCNESTAMEATTAFMSAIIEGRNP